MYSSDQIKQQGRDDRDKGVPFHRNPFRFFARSRGGHFKAAWWEAGWNERDNEIRRGDADGPQ